MAEYLIFYVGVILFIALLIGIYKIFKLMEAHLQNLVPREYEKPEVANEKKENEEKEIERKKNEEKKEGEKKKEDEETISDIVGTTKTVFLKPEPQKTEPESPNEEKSENESEEKPVLSQQLEKDTPEPEIASEDVEYVQEKIGMEDIDVDEEEFLNRYDPSDDLSQGITINSISMAIEVLDKKDATEEEQIKAGGIFSTMASGIKDGIGINENYLQLISQLEDKFTKHTRKIKYDENSFDIYRFV